MLMRGTNGFFFPKISGVHKRNCTKQVTSVLDIVSKKNWEFCFIYCG